MQNITANVIDFPQKDDVFTAFAIVTEYEGDMNGFVGHYANLIRQTAEQYRLLTALSSAKTKYLMSVSAKNWTIAVDLNRNIIDLSSQSLVG